MAISINGSTNVISGVAVGGLPDGIVDTDMLAADAVTDPKQNLSGVAKTWVNFNGSGTVAIRDSFNVGSITDNATGDYTVNFATNMSNDDYAIAISVKVADADQISTGAREMIRMTSSGGYTTSGVRVICSNVAAQSGADPTIFNCIVFGDQ